MSKFITDICIAKVSKKCWLVGKEFLFGNLCVRLCKAELVVVHCRMLS